MDKELIIRLTDKYFEGQTSLEEERLLRKYYMQRRIAPELKPYQPMFRFFVEERHENFGKAKALKIVLWTVVSAAACLLLFFSLNLDKLFTMPEQQTQSIAFIDGMKHTDVETIGAETLISLETLADGSDEACDEILLLIVND
ncbi:MAG: hypothetical protein LBR84_00960 [Tannerella sp.]|jgi:hypothetical protein|nr:hypothetical protein [Tannerella sp.]